VRRRASIARKAPTNRPPAPRPARNAPKTPTDLPSV
jgi:hypothetical protein